MKKQLSDLTGPELEKAVNDIANFCHAEPFSNFGEHGVDLTGAMIYVLRFLACELGLEIYDADLDDPDEQSEHVFPQMKNFLILLDQKAIELNHQKWRDIRRELPY